MAEARSLPAASGGLDDNCSVEAANSQAGDRCRIDVPVPRAPKTELRNLANAQTRQIKVVQIE
jgi:hypothetical protein